MVKLAAIQLCSKPNVEQNLRAIAKQLAKLTANRSVSDEYLVVIPECCLYFGGKDSDQLMLAKQSVTNTNTNTNSNTNGYKTSQLQKSLSLLAKQYQIYLVAGTMPLLSACGSKFTNTSCVYDPKGEFLGRYDKIHLFDVAVADKEKNYCESRYTQAGDQACLVSTPFANVGLTVCFDLRFPHLYQQLTKLGADIITVPSAFTRVTGKAHWQTLLQARAIENQVYIIAAGQEGVHTNGRETWGHSMIISPWGEILACLEEGEGIITTQYFTTEIDRVRSSMPLRSNFNLSDRVNTK
ncbi:MAG: carbon-nitrogen hydrolase family protein [Colwellia sp.]